MHTGHDRLGQPRAAGADSTLWRLACCVHLQDLENTTGSWDLYGVDEPKRYPGLQEQFFKQATDILSRREALNAFVALCE